MSNERHVLVHPDKPSLASAVAVRFVHELVETIAEFGGATIVLTGGSLGSGVLAAVAALPARNDVDWSLVHFWWGDERWLPAGDPDRNETQAREALLDGLAIASGNIHAFPASDVGLSLDDAAAAYAAELASFGTNGARFPTFDITFLGVGPDGHIASLFPEQAGIRETSATVVAVRSSPKPPRERLSLTLPTINSSKRVWLVLAGADKASALGLTLAGASIDEVPAAGAKGRIATVFFVDAEATAEVPENLTATEIFWTSEDA